MARKDSEIDSLMRQQLKVSPVRSKTEHRTDRMGIHRVLCKEEIRVRISGRI
jgi:hypothetical protein